MLTSTAANVFLVLVIVLTFWYFYIKKTSKINYFLKNIPSPPAVPFFGHALEFKSPSVFLEKLYKFTAECGSLFYLKLGPVAHIVVVTDYDFVEFFLGQNKFLNRSSDVKFLKPWLGNGLVTIEGNQTWKNHRKLLTPAFHFKILEQFVDIFENGGDLLVEKLSKFSGHTSVDLQPHVLRSTLNIICDAKRNVIQLSFQKISETAMGTKINVDSEEASQYLESVKNFCKIPLIRRTSFLKRYDLFFKLSKDYAMQKKALSVLHKYTNDVIAHKLQEKKETQHVKQNKRKVFLDVLLEETINGESLSMKEGHDTTAIATSFILYCLSSNKDIQDKVLEEQRYVLGRDKNATVTYNNLLEMKYLENVIKEGLRLYPPFPVFNRRIDSDITFNGVVIPEGVNVLIFALGMHMNPKYFPNPEKFDPSRHENLDKRLPFAFLPFSAGSRNCIGQKYAMLEMKSLVGKVVRNFELYPALPHHKLELTIEIVLTSLNGIKVGLRKRTL